MNHERLEQTAFSHELWYQATIEALQEDWTIAEQAAFYGRALADAVIQEKMSVGQLRQLATTLNDLDGQATRAANGNLESLADQDYFEATARRIGHHAARGGLELVKTHRRRWQYGRSTQQKQRFAYALQ